LLFFYIFPSGGKNRENNTRLTFVLQQLIIAGMENQHQTGNPLNLTALLICWIEAAQRTPATTDLSKALLVPLCLVLLQLPVMLKPVISGGLMLSARYTLPRLNLAGSSIYFTAFNSYLPITTLQADMAERFPLGRQPP
jgi:hypothetical protein